MNALLGRMLAAGLIALLGGCAHHHHNAGVPATSGPQVLDTPETVVVAASIAIGKVGNGPGRPVAAVEVVRYEVIVPRQSEWMVRLFVGEWVRLRAAEVPPLVAGISSLLGVPLELEGFDTVAPRYTTRGGTVTVSRTKQPGGMVDGITQHVGLRYQVNDWYTNDVEELRKLQSLLQEAHDRKRTIE
jgi:hypothetical protein